MKDVQGIKRGKCNACECEEYRTPPSDSPSKFRCEYCNHTPVEHVKIIKLGKCKCGDCEKYQSEEENSYTECGYCGCEASDHAGAEKLRKPVTVPPTPAAQPGMMATVPPPMMTGVHPAMMQQHPGGIQPRVNTSGQPVQSAVFGSCKNPGCPFPRRVEGGKVYDFCSRTCSQKFSALSQQFQSGGAGPLPKPPPPAGPPMTAPGPGMMRPPVVSGKLCTQCKKNPSNRGRSWCEQCYVMKGSKS